MEFLNRFLLQGPDLINATISILLAAGMGLLVSQLYKHTHRGLNYEHTFMAALVLLAPIVSVVMLYIRGDLVLSLGLIGSLSIVRFRAAIKDTRDMVFLFWVIAIGLGSGTYNWGIVLISSIIIIILVAGLYYIRYGITVNSDYVLVITAKQSFEGDYATEIIRKYSADPRLRSFEALETSRELVYELHLTDPSGNRAEKLINELKALSGVVEVSLLAPQLSLPL